MKLLKIIILYIIICFSTACTTAGPYVTNVSSNGGGLIIEKCKVQYNNLSSSISMVDCATTFLNLDECSSLKIE